MQPWFGDKKTTACLQTLHMGREVLWQASGGPSALGAGWADTNSCPFPSWHSESGTRPGRLLPSSWAVTTFHVLRKQNLTLLLTPWFCVFVPCQCQRGRKDTCRQWHWPVLCSLPQQQHWHTEVTLDLRKQQNWCHQRVFVAGLGHLHSGWLRGMRQWDRPWELLVCSSLQLV